jgi:hypothetical protein
MSQTESVPYQVSTNNACCCQQCQAFMGASAVLLAMLLLVVTNGTSANVVQGAWPCTAEHGVGCRLTRVGHLLCTAAVPVPVCPLQHPCKDGPHQGQLQGLPVIQVSAQRFPHADVRRPADVKGGGGWDFATQSGGFVAFSPQLVFRTLRASPAPLVCRALSPTECPHLAAA